MVGNGNIARLRDILATVQFGDWRFVVGHAPDGSAPYLQIRFDAPCSTTGEEKGWSSRKWALSFNMTRSEVVLTAFKAVLTALEHEARENFLYRGRAILGPHFDVDLLHELCGLGDAALDVREAPGASS